MKILKKIKVHLNLNKIYLDSMERVGSGPDFSRDPQKPPCGLIAAGEKHAKIISEINTIVFDKALESQEAQALVTALRKSCLSISPDRVIERIVAAVVTPGDFASLSTPDYLNLKQDANLKPTEFCKDQIDSISNSTGMSPHFVSIVFAYRLASAIQ